MTPAEEARLSPYWCEIHNMECFPPLVRWNTQSIINLTSLAPPPDLEVTPMPEPTIDTTYVVELREAKEGDQVLTWGLARHAPLEARYAGLVGMIGPVVVSTISRHREHHDLEIAVVDAAKAWDARAGGRSYVAELSAAVAALRDFENPPPPPITEWEGTVGSAGWIMPPEGLPGGRPWPRGARVRVTVIPDTEQAK